MKRAVIIFAVVAALLLADGLWMEVTHYRPGDQNAFFGNQHLILSDGQVVLISAGFLAVAAAVLWLVAARRQQAKPEGQLGRSGGRPASKL